MKCSSRVLQLNIIGLTRKIILPAIIIVILGVAVWSIWRHPFDLSSDYQAVFLDNGQVYFGNITKQGWRYIELTSVYYLQFRDPIQGSEANREPGGNIALVKLGEELHGPENRMIITREHILFIENLKNSSKAVQAIEADENSNQ